MIISEKHTHIQEINIKVGYQNDEMVVTGDNLELAIDFVEAVIKPFMKYPENRDRILNGDFLFIKCSLKNGLLDYYKIGWRK